MRSSKVPKFSLFVRPSNSVRRRSPGNRTRSMDDAQARRFHPLPGCAGRRRFHDWRHARVPGTKDDLSVVVSARRRHTIRRTASNTDPHQLSRRGNQTVCDVQGRQLKNERSLSCLPPCSQDATESIAARQDADRPHSFGLQAGLSIVGILCGLGQYRLALVHVEEHTYI